MAPKPWRTFFWGEAATHDPIHQNLLHTSFYAKSMNKRWRGFETPSLGPLSTTATKPKYNNAKQRGEMSFIFNKYTTRTLVVLRSATASTIWELTSKMLNLSYVPTVRSWHPQSGPVIVRKARGRRPKQGRQCSRLRMRTTFNITSCYLWERKTTLSFCYQVDYVMLGLF